MKNCIRFKKKNCRCCDILLPVLEESSDKITITTPTTFKAFSKVQNTCPNEVYESKSSIIIFFAYQTKCLKTYELLK